MWEFIMLLEIYKCMWEFKDVVNMNISTINLHLPKHSGLFPMLFL